MTDRSFFLLPGNLEVSDRLILFHQDEVLVRDGQFVWNGAQLGPELLEQASLLLIEAGPVGYIAVNLSGDYSAHLGAEKQSLRTLLFAQGDQDFPVVGKANQIVDWYNSHRYCGVCGSATMHHEAQRILVCTACQRQYFPRINPCAIVLVVKGSQILLARHSRFKSGYMSCLAGFIEIGESAEQTVHREVLEEVGLEIENVRYFKSQSWPFPSQLMLGFFADYKSGDIVPEPGEIEEAYWFDIDDLPAVPSPAISVAGELIQHYVQMMKSGSF
jgi:NAD+ diphosphatase